MKNYFLIFSCTLLFISCDSSESEVKTTNGNYLSRETISNYPFNKSNSYDLAGEVHNELLHAYHIDSFLPYTLDSICNRVDLKAKNHLFFDNLTIQEFAIVPTSRIEEIVLNGRNAFPSIISQLALSNQVKTEFEMFITMILNNIDANTSYSDIYNTIVNYESSLQDNPLYTIEEKEYILTVTSIIRHSVHVKEKRPKKNTDPDWDWLTANVFGAVEGARYGMPSAIITALKAGIKENR